MTKTEARHSRSGDGLIDEWLKQGRTPEDVNGLLKQLTKR